MFLIMLKLIWEDKSWEKLKAYIYSYILSRVTTNNIRMILAVLYNLHDNKSFVAGKNKSEITKKGQKGTWKPLLMSYNDHIHNAWPHLMSYNDHIHLAASA